MKTKLLKKARKRFAIMEVTNCGRNDLEYVETEDLSYPFYVIVDYNGPLYYIGAGQTYKTVFPELIKCVLAAYADKATRKLAGTKVYYNKK
jgi:hypothetical protein